MKNDFTDETKSLLEDFLSDAIRCQGKDSEVAGRALHNLGRFHGGISNSLSCNDEIRKHLRLAELISRNHHE
jgi:hypothetical protein